MEGDISNHAIACEAVARRFQPQRVQLEKAAEREFSRLRAVLKPLIQAFNNRQPRADLNL